MQKFISFKHFHGTHEHDDIWSWNWVEHERKKSATQNVKVKRK